MKYKLGFVSNSSSTSFCIFGVSVDGFNVDEMWNEINNAGLVTVQGISEYYEMTFIGVDPSNIKDDETFAQFKSRVAKSIEDLTGMKNVNPEYFIDGGRDG